MERKYSLDFLYLLLKERNDINIFFNNFFFLINKDPHFVLRILYIANTHFVNFYRIFFLLGDCSKVYLDCCELKKENKNSLCVDTVKMGVA